MAAILVMWPGPFEQTFIWPCRKIGQGQPSDIAWTNFIVPVHPMLYKMFQGYRPIGYGKEGFLKF